ncbi:MAG: beta-ketoacyl synthase chain length factor [Nitrospira sp.]
MRRVDLAIRSIGVLAPGLLGWEGSRPVLAGERPYVPTPIPQPEATILPPNERRRSSDSVRWAVEVAHEAMVRAGLDPGAVPAVFASSGGEISVFDQLCRLLATKERLVSPTLFHQSVHNAASGYWGIATAGHETSTALSCYDDSFIAGLVEAVALVITEWRPVLLVAYDLPVPVPLREARPITVGFAVALVLSPLAEAAIATATFTLKDARGAEPVGLADQTLEQLRTHNPAARSLPLLCTIAARVRRTVVFDWLGDQRIELGVEPCSP